MKMKNQLFLFLFVILNLICAPINIAGANEEEYILDTTRSNTTINLNITQNTTWLRDNSPYYIEKTIHIINRSVLTIEPGVEIFFNNGSKIIIGSVSERGGEDYESDNLRSEGRHFSYLIANGTLENRIRFKSNETLDNSLTGRILCGLFSNFIFRFCDFYSTGGIAIVGSDNCQIFNCNFYETSYMFIDEAQVDCSETHPSNNTISECSFINNYCGIKYKYRSSRTSKQFEFSTRSNLHQKYFLNNFINNIYPYLGRISGIWNDTYGHGNYWSDYNGTDLDNDGIGDTNLPWHEVDWCPLMDPSPAINHCNQSWLDKPPYYDPTDKDDDGLPDIWEERNGLDPTDPSDAFKDPDNDGLSNTAEYENNTNPMSDDTDDDHMKDKWEIDHGLDPADPSDAKGDADGDGLSNVAEFWNSTDALCNDTDGDGIPDGWEVSYGLDPLNASDANEDMDNNGITNLEEYRRDSDAVQLHSPDNDDHTQINLSILFYIGAVVAAFLLIIIFVVVVKRR